MAHSVDIFTQDEYDLFGKPASVEISEWIQDHRRILTLTLGFLGLLLVLR